MGKFKLGFVGELVSSFSDLPLWGRGTIRRMVDEVKRMGISMFFVITSPTASRSAPPQRGGYLASLEIEQPPANSNLLSCLNAGGQQALGVLPQNVLDHGLGKSQTAHEGDLGGGI